MAERIQDILAGQKAAAVEAGNLRAAKGLRNLQLQVARLQARGFFTQEPVDVVEKVTPAKPEKPLIVVQFSEEARTGLENEGYRVYTLTGQSIKDLREARKPFWSTWHEGYDFEALPSRLSEVAFNPEKLFLPNSNRKTLSEQEALIAKFSEGLSKGKNRIPGVEAVMGEAPDYVELAFTHLQETGDRLFGEKYGYNYARTKTPTGGSYVGRVGRFDAGYGLDVHNGDRGRGRDSVFAAPLVVPAKA